MRQTIARPGRNWLAGICLIAALTACGRDDGQLAGATSKPATAVMHLAQQLASGDLQGFARDAIPPEQHADLAQAWAQGDSFWPLTGLPLDEHLPDLLHTFGTPDEAKALRQSFDVQLAGQAPNVRQTAKSLGLFGVQYVSNHGDYNEDQRQHYRQLIQAISQWAEQAPLSQKAPAHQAIQQLAQAVQASGMTGAESLQQAGMETALQALSPVQLTLMEVLAGYGLDISSGLKNLQAGLLFEEGNRARVQVQYLLAGNAIRFEADMVRVQGNWYLSQNLDDAEKVLTGVRKARALREKQSAEAKELAEGEVAGRPQTNEKMASGP